MPALDAVLFMSPRNSQVDIVQAVGRAMRKAEGKPYGYNRVAGRRGRRVSNRRQRSITRNGSRRFGACCRALRSHDDRLEAEINQIDLNVNPTGRIIFGGDGTGEGNGNGQPGLPFPPLDLPAGAIYARIVDKCGDRKYWETWAKDVAAIFSRLVTRIEGLLEDPGHKLLREWFETFHEELKASINDSINARRRRRHDGAARPDAPGLRGAVRAVRLRWPQPGRAGPRRAAEGLRRVRPGE